MPPPSDIPSGRVPSGLTIRGGLTATADLTIECVFEGAIDVEGHHLTIAPRSEVKAAVSARQVTVHGRFDGHLTADVVRIMAGASVDANVVATTLAIEDGASFNGSVNTERARAAGQVAWHRVKGE